MKILFVKRPNNYLSHLITEVTGEPESHVAIELNTPFVIESSATGILIKPKKYFRDQTNVIRQLEPVNRIQDAKVIEKVEKLYGSFYDYGALFFLGVALTLRRYLKIPLPKSNLWQSSGMFICTELVTEIVNDEADPMITPTKLGDKLIASGEWKEV